MNILAEQDGLRLVNDFEAVFIEGAGVPNVVVGDHYGDPDGGIIDRNGAWVASFGEGVQVYRIAKPYTPYTRDAESGQWVTWDVPKDLGRGMYVAGVRQDLNGLLVVSVEGDQSYEVSFEVWLAADAISLVADGQSVRKTTANKACVATGDNVPS
jgi:hypothetical protein